jgi:hypothetical protein
VSCVGSAVWILLPHELVFAFYGQALLAVSTKLGYGKKDTQVHHADAASTETEPADASPDDRAARLRPPRKASPAIELDRETVQQQKLATRHPGDVSAEITPSPRTRGMEAPRPPAFGVSPRRADAGRDRQLDALSERAGDLVFEPL